MRWFLSWNQADGNDPEGGRRGSPSPVQGCLGWPGSPPAFLSPAHTLWGRAFPRVWTLGLKGPPPTLGSRSFQLLALSCCSSRNLRVTSSIESCRRSQKPARSWKVGTGNAVGSCSGRSQRGGSQSEGPEPQPGAEKAHPTLTVHKFNLGERSGDWEEGDKSEPRPLCHGHKRLVSPQVSMRSGRLPGTHT